MPGEQQQQQQQAAATLKAPSGYLRLCCALIAVVIRGTWAFLFQSVPYRRHQWSTKRIFLYQCFKQWKDLLDTGGVVLPTPDTRGVIAKTCVSEKWAHIRHCLSVDQGPDAALHEIGVAQGPAHAPVVLYFHGGGYHNMIQPTGHLQACRDYTTALGASTMFVLEYTLTPAGKYPTQLRQAVSALQFLLGQKRLSPSQIVMGGDSAGGHLVITLIAHIIQPHPDIRRITHFETGEARFKGAFLISPWTFGSRTDTQSFRENEAVDFLTIPRAKEFVRLWQPDESQIWAVPHLAGGKFWSQLPVERIISTCGSAECLRDWVVDFYRQLQSAEQNGTTVDLVFADGEIHVHSAFDYAFGLPPCESRRKLLQWCAKLKSE